MKDSCTRSPVKLVTCQAFSESRPTATKMSNDMVTLLKGGAISSLLKDDPNLPYTDLKGNTALIWCADAGQVGGNQTVRRDKFMRLSDFSG